MSNWVEVVGYQLEKVHAGMLAWLFDSATGTLPSTERHQLAEAFTGGFVQAGRIESIDAFREYGYKRKHIDLVLKISQGGDALSQVAVELKTDSDVDARQLDSSCEYLSRESPRGRTLGISVALGAGWATLAHTLAESQLGFGLDKVIDTFSNLSVAGTTPTYDNWIEALAAEMTRFESIEECVRAVGLNRGNVNPRWHDLHYRPGRPVYYLVYHHLRQHLEASRPSKWRVYTGVNNPVLNWSEGWRPEGPSGRGPQVFWEFNGDDLTIKVQVRGGGWADVTALREAVCAHVERADRSGGGRRARHREGDSSTPKQGGGQNEEHWYSLYRWDARLDQRSFADTAAWTWATIDEVDRGLMDIMRTWQWKP